MGDRVFTLTIRAEGAAFEEDPGLEVSSLLAALSRDIDTRGLDGPDDGVLMDLNGNRCAKWTWETKPTHVRDVEDWHGKATQGG